VPWRGWWVLVVCLVAAMTAAASAMVYANRVAHQSERQWCGLVVALDDAYRSTPPTTPLGRQVAAEMARLREQFGC
jgi:hypothetical protein